MEGEEEIEHCKIRKRGNSSSSSSSLVHRYRFKRAILLGKRGGGGGGGGVGASTPVRMMAAAKSPTAAESAACRRSEDSVSARRLAATVWEMNKVEQYCGGRRKEDSEGDSEEVRSRERNDEKKLLPGLSDPTPLLEDGTDQRRNGQRRRRSSATKNTLQLADYNPNLMEVESQAKKAQMECVIGTKSRLKDVSNGLLTSKELLKVMNRLWGFDNDQSSSSGMSLLSALKAEIDRARIQVNQLIKDQRSSRHEIDHLLKSFEEEKAVWRSKERSRIRNAISCISEELEVEKKLRKQTERLNKRLGNELAETKGALRRVTKELETEKRAKEILEQVCDELASGVGEDRDIVEEVKRETAKVREEVEKEREMLLLADVLREERVQMKLSEAKYLFEEKNAAVDRLKNELECYLMTRGGNNGKEDGDELRNDCDRIKELEAYLKEIEFGALQKSRESLDTEVVLQGGDDDDDDSGDESERHSIELTMENINNNNNNNNNNKPYKWSFEGIVLDNPKRISVDKDMKGIEWGSISLYKKDSSSDNVVTGLLLDSDAINHEIQQILDKERQSCSGLDSRDEDDLRRKSSAKSLRDFLLLSGSRRESTASAQTSCIIPLQELSNGVGAKGERRLSTSSKQ